MSANRGRISLLAGSSLAAATIILSAGGVALMPTAALAANECAPVGVDPSVNGPTADTYACAGANTYATTGITYSSAGNLTVNSTGAMSVGTVGINLTANTTDAVTFTATGVITGTAGPVIDVTSVSGPISITSAGVTGTNVNVTHGVQAVSTGGGAVSVTNTAGNVNINSNTAGALQQTAIRAVSTGGNGAVSVTTAGNVTGRLRGIEAQASGTGALTVTATGGVAVNTGAGVGVAAIDARTGSGLLSINIDTGSGTINGSSGSAILTNAGGDAVINIATGRQVSASSSTTPTTMNLTSVGATTVNNAGSISAGTLRVAITAAGGGFTLENTGTVFGRVNLAAVTGAATVNNDGLWNFNGASDLGAGTSILDNTGTLVAFGDSTFTDLEQLNNSGILRLGANVLSAPGTLFTGSDDSTIEITTTLAGAQTECGDGVAGCLDLTGGATAGVTSLLITSDGLSSVFDPVGIVLVDVGGGTSAAGHFVLDPSSSGYLEDPVLGGSLATPGLFAYALHYNTDTQQHMLLSAPRREAFEFTPVIHEALSAWHTTTDAVIGRQADLGAGANGGAWVRVVAEHSDRDLPQSFSSTGATFTFDTGYSLETGAAIAGFDLIKGGAVTLGVHGGYVKSELAFDGSETRDLLTGPTAGVYGGWRSGPLSIDATINANLLELDRESVFEHSATNIVSVGGRAEGGWKIALGEPFFIQPLVTVAYVKSTIEDLLPTGYDLSFEGAESTRAAIGLRAGGDVGPLGMWVTGRAWNEFSGDSAVVINNTGSTTGVTFADDLSGNFQEIGAGLTLANEGDTLRGFISTGAKLRDGIDNYSFSLGLRLSW